MKIWIDDVRIAPEGYVWCKSVEETVSFIEKYEYECRRNSQLSPIELLDIDHDAGDYAQNGGDYIKILDWLEETERRYPIHIHSMNPVGASNMRAIIRKNGWLEV